MNWIGKWWTNSNFLAQAAHFLLGTSVVFLPMSLWGINFAYIGTGVLVLYSIVKEVFVDPWAEGETFIYGGLIDMIFLLGGSTVAWLLYYFL